MSYYGTLLGANEYFNDRLHSESWSDSAPADPASDTSDL